MPFHENHLLDDSHEMSHLIFSEKYDKKKKIRMSFAIDVICALMVLKLIIYGKSNQWSPTVKGQNISINLTSSQTSVYFHVYKKTDCDIKDDAFFMNLT